MWHLKFEANFLKISKLVHLLIPQIKNKKVEIRMFLTFPQNTCNMLFSFRASRSDVMLNQYFH